MTKTARKKGNVFNIHCSRERAYNLRDPMTIYFGVIHKLNGMDICIIICSLFYY